MKLCCVYTRPLKGKIFPNWCNPIAEHCAQPWLPCAPQSIFFIFKFGLLSLIPEAVVRVWDLDRLCKQDPGGSELLKGSTCRLSCLPGAGKVPGVKSQQVKGPCPRELQSAQQSGEAVTWELTSTASQESEVSLARKEHWGASRSPAHAVPWLQPPCLCPHSQGAVGAACCARDSAGGAEENNFDAVLRLHMVVEDHVWSPVLTCTLSSKKPQTTCVVLIFWRQVGDIWKHDVCGRGMRHQQNV